MKEAAAARLNTDLLSSNLICLNLYKVCCLNVYLELKAEGPEGPGLELMKPL